MSLDSLEKLKEVLNTQFDFSDTEKSRMTAFLSHYKSGYWIYPGVLKREFHISISTVYKMLEELVKAGVVEGWYEYCCGNCQHVLGTVRRFNELPDTFECDNCGSTVITMENIIKIYRVL